MHVLAGDIGGTKILLALVECAGDRCTIHRKSEYKSRNIADLVASIKSFLQEENDITPERACFAVAGPVSGHTASTSVQLTNLPLELDSSKLQDLLNIPQVQLLNDFQCVAYGLDALQASDLVTVQTGEAKTHGIRAVLGAGTGLGQTILYWDNDHYSAQATEGGHVEFAPRDQEQMELLSQLISEFGHVSWERLLSGSGLVRIYRFFQQQNPANTTLNLDTFVGDPAAQISSLGLDGEDSVAAQALDLFVRIYGAQAGNLALTAMASGGVYVAGGIAPKILAKLKEDIFIKAFNDKGRMAAVTRRIPVHIIDNPNTGLLGAALVASRL